MHAAGCGAVVVLRSGDASLPVISGCGVEFHVWCVAACSGEGLWCRPGGGDAALAVAGVTVTSWCVVLAAHCDNYVIELAAHCDMCAVLLVAALRMRLTVW
jgi:hypothetical protein